MINPNKDARITCPICEDRVIVDDMVQHHNNHVLYNQGNLSEYHSLDLLLTNYNLLGLLDIEQEI